MNRLKYSMNNDEEAESIIPGQDRKKKHNPKKQHKKDDSIEEFVDEDADEESWKNKKDKEKRGKGMGRSDKAKKQHSDEGDAGNK